MLLYLHILQNGFKATYLDVVSLKIVLYMSSPIFYVFKYRAQKLCDSFMYTFSVFFFFFEVRNAVCTLVCTADLPVQVCAICV